MDSQINNSSDGLPGDPAPESYGDTTGNTVGIGFDASDRIAWALERIAHDLTRIANVLEAGVVKSTLVDK